MTEKLMVNGRVVSDSTSRPLSSWETYMEKYIPEERKEDFQRALQKVSKEGFVTDQALWAEVEESVPEAFAGEYKKRLLTCI